MPFDLNTELKNDQRVIEAAAKKLKALAEVGVTAKEIADAKARLKVVVGERKKLAAETSHVHGVVHDKHELIDEGALLVAHVRARVGIALDAVTVDARVLHDAAGIGAHTVHTAESVATAAVNLADIVVDKRFAAVCKRAGITAADVKHLRDIAAALARESPAAMPTDAALPASLAALRASVKRLRKCARAVFPVHSTDYAPFRAPAPRAAKAAAAAKPAA